MDTMDARGLIVIVSIVMLAAIFGGFAYLFWLAFKTMQERNGKCPNCGRPVKKTYLFCPWPGCYHDLRGGGKN